MALIMALRVEVCDDNYPYRDTVHDGVFYATVDTLRTLRQRNDVRFERSKPQIVNLKPDDWKRL